MNELPPSKKERRLVYRCILTQDVLIGSERDIWEGASSTAEAALCTLRICLRVVTELVQAKMAVDTAAIRKRAIQIAGQERLGVLYLNEMCEYLISDHEARDHWDTCTIEDRYPVRCPLCKTAAAFVGLNTVECKAKCAPSSSRL